MRHSERYNQGIMVGSQPLFTLAFFVMKLIALIPRTMCFAFLVSWPFSALLMLVLVAACVMPLHLDMPYITLITYPVEVTNISSSGQLVVVFFIVKEVLGFIGKKF